MTAIDPFSQHEVVHTASIMQSIFERHILDHPFVQATPELRNAAGAVNEALAAFYQQVGAIPVDLDAGGAHKGAFR